MTDKVRITPRGQRASWARRPSYLDDEGIEADMMKREQGATMSPKVQQVCERITKGVETLLEAIGDGHKLWLREELNDADRKALKEAAALVGQRLGKPVR